MTDPLSPWPQNTPRGGPGRELVGVLLALAGLAVLVWLLATVDWRLPVALVALCAVAGGVWLTRGEDAADEEA